MAVDGKKAYMCTMQQSCKEENLYKTNFIFYFLRSVHKFYLFVAFIERLMLLSVIIIIKGEIAGCEQFTIKLCVNIILFVLFTCCISTEYNKGVIFVLFYLNKPKLTTYSDLYFLLMLQF